MILVASANTLTLASTNGEIVLDASDLPARTTDDLLEFLPSWAREPVAPIRDAWLEMVRSVAQLAWARIGQSASRLISPRFAEGTWLDAWGDLKKVARRYDEDDGPYRARLLAVVSAITPNAIRAAIAAAAASITTQPVVLLEPAIDSMFTAPLTSTWNCFVQPATARLWGSDPDRVGVAWGPYTFDPVMTARIVVAVADGAGSLDPVAYSTALSTAMTSADTSFSAPTGAAYAFVFSRTDSLLELLVAAVDSLRAGGVGFTLFTDSALARMR